MNLIEILESPSSEVFIEIITSGRKLMRTILLQDTVWIPKKGFCLVADGVAIKDLDYSKKEVVNVEDIDDPWKANILEMLEKLAPELWISSETLEEMFVRLETDNNVNEAQKTWLYEQPLVKKLAE